MSFAPLIHILKRHIIIHKRDRTAKGTKFSPLPQFFREVIARNAKRLSKIQKAKEYE